MRLAAVCFAFTLLPASYAWAQVDTGTIAGAVTDESGGVLPGVTVTVSNPATGQVRTAVTNDIGKYQVAALQPSRYTVKIELSGFGSVIREGVTVNVGATAEVDVILKVASHQETIIVTGEAPLVDAAKTDVSSVVSKETIETLPSRTRSYLDYALLMPAAAPNTSTSAQGVPLNMGGARGKESALLVDGFYNLDEGFAKVKQRYSEDSIQEFQIVNFGGAAEFGRAIGGIMNAVTRSGSNVVSGSGYGFTRNQALNAMDFGSRAIGLTSKPSFKREQGGGTLGLPLKEDKSFLFLAYEKIHEDTPYNDVVTPANAAAIGLLPQDAGNIPQFLRQDFTMAKWDHVFNQNQRIEAAFAWSHWWEFNQSAAPYRTLSAEYGLAANDYSLLFKWDGISENGKKIQELKVSYFPRYYGVNGLPQGGPPVAPTGQINLGFHNNASPPRVTISSVATFGSATLCNSIDTYPAQVIYTSSKYTGRHTIKFGADYMVAYYNYTLYSPLSGSYSFSSLANFLAGKYSQYSQQFGDPNNPRWHQYISGFVQDSYQASGRMTLNYGLRYDLEINPKQKRTGIPFGNEYKNFGPRFGLAYDLTGKHTTFLKASGGIYYDRLFQNITTYFPQLEDHLAVYTATWTPTSAGAPVYPQVFATQPANLPSNVVDVYLNPSQVHVPANAQFLTNLEHAITPHLSISGSVVYTRTWHREYLWDNNIQWSDSLQKYIRPSSSYRAIYQYIFGGKAQYVGGIFQVRARTDKLGFNGNLTLASDYESSSNYGNTINDPRLGIDSDWGPATDTPKVRGVMSGWYNIIPAIQAAASFSAQTGIAVNPIASGLDLLGTGNLGTRTPGFSRDSFRGPSINQVDARFTWVPFTGKKRLYIYLEAFNLLNHDNVKTVSNDYGSNLAQPKAIFLTPTAWYPPREIQLGLRFTF
jgi:hypothetical protein